MANLITTTPNSLPQNSDHTTNIPKDVSKDVEKQDSIGLQVLESSPTEVVDSTEPGMEDNSYVPKLSIFALFWFFFYNFGIFAWGGPVAQIALLKERLVLQDKWITVERFQRVFAVYQILPGPEAAELCMFFGCLSAGRIGGIVAGIGFILPGFILMLLASYLYSLAGFENVYFNASFKALQPIVAAMILKAVHKIADHSVIKQKSKKVDPFLVIAALCTAINIALRINIFISLGFYGIWYSIVARRFWILSGILWILQYVGFALYVVFRGFPSPLALALGIAQTPSLINLFILGLVAGSLSFGGAYTAIPFIQVEAVLKGGWLPQSVFIDCIAIGNILPAPLVIFATFVGFQGGLQDGGLGAAFAGAIIITIGMFFPCFLFTILLATFFDGLCGSVVGVIAVIAAQIFEASVHGEPRTLNEAANSGLAAVMYLLALIVLYKFTNKWAPLVLSPVESCAISEDIAAGTKALEILLTSSTRVSVERPSAAGSFEMSG
ncbi:chromate transporter [Glarea lozoyensis ATCC 20868]|uniref:Chromate transporter n=1 Tax=Glarea lozoyensis (strain ATCC 20868 / MF5171) TaxID=1116229 RepID=S3CM93_GLAL2|nr:chromate transporter [Glarea lozoyensis ATCC 20868]EPE26800.1 chromate transporter [Glarea lozoyensis ATCC 20868]